MGATITLTPSSPLSLSQESSRSATETPSKPSDLDNPSLSSSPATAQLSEEPNSNTTLSLPSLTFTTSMETTLNSEPLLVNFSPSLPWSSPTQEIQISSNPYERVRRYFCLNHFSL